MIKRLVALTFIFAIGNCHIAYADIMIHVHAVGEDLFVTIMDKLDGKQVNYMTPVANDNTVFPTVSTDNSFKAHIHWYAVSHKHADGTCLWGDADVASLDDSTLVNVSVMNRTPNINVTLPCM